MMLTDMTPDQVQNLEEIFAKPVEVNGAMVWAVPEWVLYLKKVVLGQEYQMVE